MKLIKIRKLLAKESLCRARKRVRRDLKQTANDMIYANIGYDGTNGYLRDRKCYGK